MTEPVNGADVAVEVTRIRQREATIRVVVIAVLILVVVGTLAWRQQDIIREVQKEGIRNTCAVLDHRVASRTAQREIIQVLILIAEIAGLDTRSIDIPEPPSEELLAQRDETCDQARQLEQHD